MSRDEASFANEDRLIPVIRAALAKRLSGQGFRVSEIARGLRVTQPAVEQYLKGKRGVGPPGVKKVDELVEPLAARLASRVRTGGAIEMAELLETARQVMVMSAVPSQTFGPMGSPNEGAMPLLRARLRLELDAAEKYLALSNQTSDDYTKLLFRMIAADSIRHGDVVSQLISWLEKGGSGGGSIPDEAILKKMVALEDSAGEASLLDHVDVRHPVAQLLLRWIDFDENKHDEMVRGLISLRKSGELQSGGRPSSRRSDRTGEPRDRNAGRHSVRHRGRPSVRPS
jgi:predicted transcriptional regulator